MQPMYSQQQQQQQALIMLLQAQQAAMTQHQQLDGSNPAKRTHSMPTHTPLSWDTAALQMMMMQGQFPMYPPYMMAHPAFSSS